MSQRQNNGKSGVERHQSSVRMDGLRRCLKNAHMTPEELAEAARVSHRAITGWLGGERASLKTARLVANALEVPIAMLEEEQPSGNPPWPTRIGGWTLLDPTKMMEAANGVQWRVFRGTREHAEFPVARMKQYDLSSRLADQERSHLEKYIQRHKEVCDRLNGHPNITRNLGAFADDRRQGFWWVADEFLDDHRALDEWIRSPQPIDSIASFFLDIAHALEALHANEVILRGLRPASVLIGPRAVLTDFELARLTQGRPTVTDLDELGQDVYRAPEVETGDPDPSCDVYSWAMMLAHAVGGKRPQGPDDARTMIGASKLNKGTKTLASKCLGLAKKRPPTGQALVEALTA